MMLGWHNCGVGQSTSDSNSYANTQRRQAAAGLIATRSLSFSQLRIDANSTYF
jgi:hypothetical protein